MVAAVSLSMSLLVAVFTYFRICAGEMEEHANVHTDTRRVPL